ncbi:hypothetical protein UFOVP328_179 [uncultured Caudovirales phage]|uniref:Uncharacterized protein n=1 Tax=uncultured Caudovirales phage TaxID=2100421 RepID=A0A6J5LYK2_9CAUD|nr:hypothetical protein UFOVP328_179 [uncultured Caudovirales phage]
MNYEFCDDLSAPELCVIMNRIWWINNQAEIREFLGMEPRIVQEQMLIMPDPTVRTMFRLKWPQT